MVESGENPFSAACREAREETALDALDFLWGQVFFETPPYGAGKVARYYVACSETGEIELAAAPQLGRPEHDEFRWVDFRDAGTLLAPRLLPVLDWVHRLTGC